MTPAWPRLFVEMQYLSVHGASFYIMVSAPASLSSPPFPSPSSPEPGGLSQGICTRPGHRLSNTLLPHLLQGSGQLGFQLEKTSLTTVNTLATSPLPGTPLLSSLFYTELTTTETCIFTQLFTISLHPYGTLSPWGQNFVLVLVPTRVPNTYSAYYLAGAALRSSWHLRVTRGTGTGLFPCIIPGYPTPDIQILLAQVPPSPWSVWIIYYKDFSSLNIKAIY